MKKFMQRLREWLKAFEPLRKLVQWWRRFLTVRSAKRRLLGMTTRHEQKYLKRHIQHEFTGNGEIVDLGCWLGSTTIPMAKGLQENPHRSAADATIHSYDRFIWESAYMEGVVRWTPLEGRFKDGDSFCDAFHERIQPWANRVKVYEGDLSCAQWCGRRIEFLMIDAMKSWELANSIQRIFYPSMVAGLTVVFHQDFAHWYTPWIHLLNYRFRDYFEKLSVVRASPTVVFKYVQTIPEDLLMHQYSAESFSDEEIELAFSHSLSLVASPQNKANVTAARITHYLNLDRRDAARAVFDQAIADRLPLDSELRIVEQQLNL